MEKKPFIIDLRDLRTTDKEGAFKCPQCGVIISPKDETEEIYEVVMSKVKNSELSEIVLKCNKCKSIIRVIGFEALSGT